MNTKTLFAVLACASSVAWAQGSLRGGGFNAAGAYQLQVTGGPVQIETSTNLSSWAALTNAQGTVSDSVPPAAEWKYYRAKNSSNVVGFVRVPVGAGQQGMVANPFTGNLDLNNATVRSNVFGSATPMVQVFLYKSGKMVSHTFDDLTGGWDPGIPEIPAGTGFAVRNNAQTPLKVTFSGEVAQGALKRPIPGEDTLMAPLVPKPGPAQEALGAPALDGAQILVFNEQRQQFQTSTYNKQANRWDPQLAYRPGRALMIRVPQPSLETNFKAGQ